MTTTSAPLLGEPLPVELMNTIWADQVGVHDALVTTGDLRSWLSAVAQRDELSDLALDRPVTQERLAELRDLRDALRVLAADITSDVRPAAEHTRTQTRHAVRTINAASSRAPSWPELRWRRDGPATWRTASPLTAADVAGSRIAGLAAELFGSAKAQQLRACYAPGCVLYFLGRHSAREWCSAGCGNRARVARHYQRHRNERQAARSPSP